MGEISYTISSKPYQILEKNIQKEGKFPVISQSANFIEGYTDEKDFLLDKIPVTIFGDHTRNVKYIDFNFVVGADGVKILKTISIINPLFFYYLILDASLKIEDRGYGRHFQFIDKYLYALPPINEQTHIVSEIQKIFQIIESLESDRFSLQTAIKQAKSKILDLAIHGKLVPQDPNDEPAEELLKRIATSDNRPYKKFDEEVLFEIPESWTWCFLHTISALLNGDRGENYPSKKDYVESGIPFINAGCLDNGNIEYGVANYITEEKYNSLRAGKIQKGDILYCLRGSLGKTGFVITDNKGAISSLCIFRLTEAIIPQYFLYVLNSNAIKVQQKMVDNGTAQPNLSAKDVSNYAIPIPPLAEQHRIVAKIEELFKKLDEILQNLSV